MAQVQLLYVDGSVEKVDKESAEALQALRQTTALLTAAALHQQFDGIRLGDNQATDDGFFIDSDKDEVQVSADELEAVAAIVKSFGKDKAKVEFESADLAAAKALYPNDQFQQELFEDLISEEVADNNVTVETGYNNTTYVDPQKDFDIDSIVVKQIFGSNNNLISNAYYNFINTDVNIVYHTDLIYDRTAARNHLIYSCWCRNEANIIKSGSIKALSFYSKDAYNWYFICKRIYCKNNL